MFTAAQALKLYEYDLAVLESAGKRERLLEESGPRKFIVKQRNAPNGILRVLMKELLGEEVCRELYRRFA